VTTQDAITNVLAALSGSTAALVAVLCVATALWFGAEHAISSLDCHVPVRQLVLGRTLHAVAMYGRYVRTLIIARMATLPGRVRRKQNRDESHIR
jgi:hypothetical protein